MTLNLTVVQDLASQPTLPNKYQTMEIFYNQSYFALDFVDFESTLNNLEHSMQLLELDTVAVVRHCFGTNLTLAFVDLVVVELVVHFVQLQVYDLNLKQAMYHVLDFVKESLLDVLIVVSVDHLKITTEKRIEKNLFVHYFVEYDDK